MIFGAHVTSADMFRNTIPRAEEMGISAIQVFASPPRNWKPPKISADFAASFGKKARMAGIDYIFFHGIYLLNLATSDHELLQKSKQSLIAYLNLNAAMGGNGVIFHIGNAERSVSDLKDQIVSNINEILSQSDPASMLILETNAGRNHIGNTFEGLKTILDDITEKNRVGICLDTAHIFASGYDLVGREPASIIEEFDNKIGLNYLKVIHSNDSKSGLGSNVDRHENIGQGKLGDEVFRKLLHLPELASIPFIIETPGFKNQGPDEENIDHLKDLAR